jgi:hypothetical protein
MTNPGKDIQHIFPEYIRTSKGNYEKEQEKSHNENTKGKAYILKDKTCHQEGKDLITPTREESSEGASSNIDEVPHTKDQSNTTYTMRDLVLQVAGTAPLDSHRFTTASQSISAGETSFYCGF